MHCLMIASLPWGIFFSFLMRAGILICRLKVLWGFALVFSVVRRWQRAETPLCNWVILIPKQEHTHAGQEGRWCTHVEPPVVWTCILRLKVSCHLGGCVPGWKMTHVLLRSVLCFVKWMGCSRVFQNLGGEMFWDVKAFSLYIIYYNSILYLR